MAVHDVRHHAVPASRTADHDRRTTIGRDTRSGELDGTPLSDRAPSSDSFAASDGLVVSDRELVAEVLAGDPDAFRPLVEREGPALVRACYRILGDLGEAEDVAQEAFVIAYRSLESWRADGPFGAWLTRIGVRLAIRRARGRRSVVRIDVPSVPSATADPDRGSMAFDVGAPIERHDPAIIVAGSERASELRRAVARLGEPYGEVVALRFFGERSLGEIASLTGRPLATVKTHLRRGLLRLRDELGTRDAR